MEAAQEWEEEGGFGLKPRALRVLSESGGNEDVSQDGTKDNGMSRPSIYLDVTEGLWKCCHCPWTCPMESPVTGSIQSHKKHWSCDTKLATASEDENSTSYQLSSSGGERQIRTETDLSHQEIQNVVRGVTHGIHEHDAKDFPGQKYSSENYENEARSSSPVGNMVEEVPAQQDYDIKTGIADRDVERILEKQDAYDLYCPNCHSCITKRVILRKRKRVAPDISDPAKNEHFVSTQFELEEDSVEPTPSDSNSNPDVFRCLTCFSYFISTASGFRLLQMFRRRDMDDSTHASPQTPLPKVTAVGQTSTAGSANMLQKESGLISGQSDERLPCLDRMPSEGQTSETIHTDAQEKCGGCENKFVIPKEELVLVLEEDISFHNATSKFKEGMTAVERHNEVTVTSMTLLQSKRDQIHTGSVIHTAIAHPSILEAGEQSMAERDWDVLKSIVYGGLIESITSLGVVSSAAGSNASTLEIVVIGLANLIGGLCILINNLVDLMKDQEINDRYYRTLGRRENFWLHAIVVIGSYVVFGSISPVVYGFSFKKINNKYYKLMAVEGASLFSILLLAIGKAHVHRPPRPYMKIIMRYVIMGVTLSGLSFVVGHFLESLFAKISLFESSVNEASKSKSSILGLESNLGWRSS